MIKNYFKFLKILLLVQIIVLGGNNLAIAEENTYFLTSKSLLTYCQSNLPAEDGICQGYLAGVTDSVYSGHLSDFISICVPKGITTSELKALFVSYATKYPEFFERAADGLFTDALASKFSC